VRSGELLRVIWNGRRRGWASNVPRELKKLRVWLLADADGRLRLAGEGECEDEAAAAAAEGELRRQLETMARSTLARMAAGALLDPSSLWVDGRIVRYDAPLDERVIDLAAAIAGCPPGDPCTP